MLLCLVCRYIEGYPFPTIAEPSQLGIDIFRPGIHPVGSGLHILQTAFANSAHVLSMPVSHCKCMLNHCLEWDK